MRRIAIPVALATLTMAAAAEPLLLVPDDCAPRPLHRPAPDVAYAPGVDAYGRAVTPADLPGGADPVIDTTNVGVAIEVPILQAAEQTADGGTVTFEGFDATAEIGTVTVDADGTTRLDGRALAPRFVVPPGCRTRP